MEPLVSILIPAYNAEAWIAETIKSAIQQTWRRKEIIVVDDGSTDQTLTVARQFASRDVTVITQENQGASAARNHALSLSQGDYIQWLDADDLLSPDKIEKQMEALKECRNTRTLFSSEWGYFAYRTARTQFFRSSLWCDLSPAEWLLRKMGENLHMQTATWLVSRELTEAAGPWDVRLLNDNDGEYFCRVILASNVIRFVPGAKVFYRITPPGRVSYIGRSDKKKEAMFLSMRLHVKYLLSMEDSDRVRAACIAYLQNWLIIFYPERPDIVIELEKLASSLGGRLEMPRLRWKYAWIKPLFGFGPAKRAEFLLPQLKTYLVRSWDRAMYDLEEVCRRGRPRLDEPQPDHSTDNTVSANKLSG
jgi:glycosyltransferase involved in cell wall biosynthesis